MPAVGAAKPREVDKSRWEVFGIVLSLMVLGLMILRWMISIRPVIATACGLTMLLGTSAGSAELSVGDIAPQFELQGSDGEQYRLVDLLDAGGTDGVVLAWFPKAFTGG